MVVGKNMVVGSQPTSRLYLDDGTLTQFLGYRQNLGLVSRCASIPFGAMSKSLASRSFTPVALARHLIVL